MSSIYQLSRPLIDIISGCFEYVEEFTTNRDYIANVVNFHRFIEKPVETGLLPNHLFEKQAKGSFDEFWYQVTKIFAGFEADDVIKPTLKRCYEKSLL